MRGRRRHRHRRLAAVAAASAGSSAQGQEPGTEVGGTVPSTLELSIDSVGTFAPFGAGPSSRQLLVRARVTSTDKVATLSIADGDVTSGPRVGRLSAALSQPLEIRVGATGPYKPLDEISDAALVAFDGARRERRRHAPRASAGARRRAAQARPIRRRC